jgi:adenylate cyclase
MAVEIERKFLVAGEGWRRAVVRTRRIRQGYLASGDRAAVRVRCTDGADGALTIKSAKAGAVRGEFEYAIPYADAEQLLALCSGALIEKLRHDAPLGGHCWEIDVFQGVNRGLVVAEVELDHEEAAFEKPGWLGKEITHERRYYNAALAEHPFSEW